MNIKSRIFLSISVLVALPSIAMVNEQQITTSNDSYAEYFALKRGKINKHIQQDQQKAQQHLKKWDTNRIEEYKQKKLQEKTAERQGDMVAYPLGILSSIGFMYVVMQGHAPNILKLPALLLAGSLFFGSLHHIVKTKGFTTPVTSEDIDQMVKEKIAKIKKTTV